MDPVKTVWDDPAFAKAWNDTYGIDMQNTSVRANLVFPLFAEHIGSFEDKNLADFGCGNGNLIRHFRNEPFASWTGIDGGRAILDTAIENTHDTRVTFKHRDLCTAFTDVTDADVVTSVFVAEEIPAVSLRTYFANIAGALKSGGQALVFTQHPAYAMMESHRAMAEDRPNTKFEAHKGYFDTDPSTYALKIMNQTNGAVAMARYHHKMLMTLVNDAAAENLSVTSMLETPASVASMAGYRTHTPMPTDFPRFLFIAFKKQPRGLGYSC